MTNEIKILIVDDSAVIKSVLEEVFASDDAFKVIGTASDPYHAAEIMRKQVPDVITLDIEMPRMNGLVFLTKLMKQHPLPVVVVSTLSYKGSKTGLKALEYGAVAILNKADILSPESLIKFSSRLMHVVKEASKVNVKKWNRLSLNGVSDSAPLRIQKGVNPVRNLICIGSSAGGTLALEYILKNVPINSPAIVIVQHMPKEFTGQFAERLNVASKLNVSEARQGDRIYAGKVLISPGDRHILIKKDDAGYFVSLKDGVLVNGHKPAVDPLFKSAANHAGGDAIGVILTGMGKDGSKGLLEMKNAGSRTLAQDEASSIVFGMPKEAIRIGAAQETVSLTQMPNKIMKWVFKK